MSRRHRLFGGGDAAPGSSEIEESLLGDGEDDGLADAAENGLADSHRRLASASVDVRAKVREKKVYAPRADLPSNDPRHGPRFHYEIDPMMRIVYEGKGVRKIARYREKKLVNFGWASWRVWKASYLASPFCWLQILLLWCVALLVGVIVYFVLVSFDEKTAQRVEKGLSISETLRTLAAFILGYYMEKTINIWWTLRHDTLQQLMNVVDNMCLRMAIYFPGSHEEDVEARETIMRYGILSLALLFKDAQEVDVWTEREAQKANALDLDDLVAEGLVTPKEAALLHNTPARSQMCWVWISSLFTKWCLDGRLPDPLGNQNTMLEYSQEARNAISTILAQLNMQVSLRARTNPDFSHAHTTRACTVIPSERLNPTQPNPHLQRYACAKFGSLTPPPPSIRIVPSPPIAVSSQLLAPYHFLQQDVHGDLGD